MAKFAIFAQKLYIHMNANYSYLNISVTFADKDTQQLKEITFNSAPSVTLPSIEELAGGFLNLSEGYLMWCVEGKRAFSYFKLDTPVEGSALAITVMLDADTLIPGRQIVNLLSAIRNRTVYNDTLSTDILESLATETGMPEEPMRGAESACNLSGTGVCCRTYMSGSELATIFSFPDQKDYADYRGVLIVPATVSMMPGKELPVITSPVDKSLTVVCPPDVTASATKVALTDKLTLTYHLSDFDTVSETFEVGTTNRFVRINGPALMVNNALHAGIIFRKRIPYSVKSSTGQNIDTYTVLINGRTASRTDDGFEISNLDFTHGKAGISVSSTNFSQFSGEYTAEELFEAAPLDIVLEPESKSVRLRLDFGSTRIFEVSVDIEKNTPEYNMLRSGNFHGFRAHKLMGTKPDTYNVDVTATKETPSTAQTSLRQPVIEKATIAEPKEPKKEELPKTSGNTPKAPEFVKETSESLVADTEESNDTKRRGWVIAIFILAIALAAGIVWYLMSLFPSEPTSNGEDVSDVTPAITAIDSTKQENTAADNATATPAQTTPQATSVPDAMPHADIAYMNANTKWQRDSLQSDIAIALFDAITSGNIEAVVTNPYFTTAGRATNTNAVKVADLLWAAKGSDTERSNIRVMSKLKDAKKVDLHELFESLARVRPAEPNTAPRPGAEQ